MNTREHRTYYRYKDGLEMYKLNSINSEIQKAAQSGLFLHTGRLIGMGQILHRLNKTPDRFHITRSAVDNWVHEEPSLRADGRTFQLHEGDVDVLVGIIETILGYRGEAGTPEFAPESSYSSIEPIEILRKGLTTKKAAEYLRDHHGMTISHEGVRHHCLSKLNALPHEKREESPGGREVFIIHPAHLDEFAANHKQKEKLHQSPPPVEDKPEKKDIDQLLAARLEWEKSMERRFDILERAVAELKRQMVEEFSRANEREERRFADTNARVDEVSKKQTITSSWLRENFSSEWKESDS